MGDGEQTAGTTAIGGELPDPEPYEISQPCTHEELLAVAKVYARAVVRETGLTVSVSELDWEMSTRAQRRAGATTYRDGEPQSIKLAWKQFERRGWEATASTIRHELIHVHLLNEDVGSGHGEPFRRLAAELETDVHCERFTDPKWWVHCTECDATLARYRRSKLISNPDSYKCANCGGDFRVEAND